MYTISAKKLCRTKMYQRKILRQSGYFQGDIELVCCYENCKVEMIYTHWNMK